MKASSKISILILCLLVGYVTFAAESNKLKISNKMLLDKIKGGWAGQTIGVTYGGSTEFKYLGTMIQDYIDIYWCDEVFIENFVDPGLYDDIYVDMTFAKVIESCGIDAPVDSFATHFAHSQYPLWAANQQARYNILNGIKAPQSGHWTNNPFAESLDFEIESDFAGLMSPGMPRSAVEMCNKVGRIMNSGDGLYAGMYLATLYSLAYTSNDMNYIVEEGLKAIPEGSQLKMALTDVVAWHKKYPTDWKQCWFEVERKWSEDTCIKGAFAPFNVEALNNCCYVLIGLLYGDGDFFKTIDISTRCGQDSDCNPSNAGGILGAMIGYDAIPEFWKKGLYKVEDIKIKWCGFQLDSIYITSFKNATAQILKNGGVKDGDGFIIEKQKVAPQVALEKNFDKHIVQGITKLGINLTDSITIKKFDFNGIVIGGGIDEKNLGKENSDYVAKVDVFIDQKWVETINFPATFVTRNPLFFYKYKLDDKNHILKFVWKNPKKGVNIQLDNALIYKSTARVRKQYK